MDAGAVMAAAIISYHEAQTLKGQLATDLDIMDTINFKWRTEINELNNRVSMIQDACDVIEYINAGRKNQLCTNLRTNPFHDSFFRLSVLNYDKRICTSGSNIEREVRIPASRTGSKTNDVLNLEDLIFTGTAVLNIASFQWLQDNDWVPSTARCKRGLFVQKFNVFLPPAHFADGTDHKVEVLVYHLQDNQLVPKGKTYALPKMPFFVDYSVKFKGECTSSNHRINLYGNQPSMCVNYERDRTKGKFVPTAYGTWMIELRNNQQKKSKRLRKLELKNVGDDVIYLKALVQVCFGAGFDESCNDQR